MFGHVNRLRSRAHKTTLRCEALEDRIVLATFTVNALGDTVDANPGDGIAADAGGMTTLRAALEEANALAGADNVDFSVAGMINLSLGELTISDDVSVDGGGGAVVNAGAASRVMSVTGGTSTLSNIVLENGSEARGGGLNIDAGADVTLSGATVRNSSAVDFGGGIFSRGTLTLTNASLVTGNSAGSGVATAYGGGIVSYQGDLTIDGSTVSNNSSTQYGGGIFALQGSALITNNSLVTGNSVNNTAGAYSSGAGVSGAAGIYGGAAGIAPVNVTINNGSTISNNTLYGTNFGYGAGVYTFGYGSLTIDNATISGNSNTGSGGARGGAGFNWPAGIAPGTLYMTITDSVIDGNYAAEESGGFGFRGVSLTRAVDLTMSGNTISNNRAALGSGGAGFLWSGTGDPLSGTVEVVDTVVSGNYAGATGGGLEINNANATITNTTIDGNTALSSGGGFYSGTGGLDMSGLLPSTITFSRSTVSNNYAILNAGAVYAYDSNIVLDNSTLSGNTSVLFGGGVRKVTLSTYAGGPYDTVLDLTSATLTNNYAGESGGAIHANPYALVRSVNSIVSGNSALVTGTDIYNYAAGIVPDFAYSFVGDNTGSLLTAANPDAMGNKIGDAAGPLNAMLGALANNGGDTLTHLPMMGSPVIDMGDPTSMGGTDQTGDSRVNDGRIDMGSVETGVGMPVVDCDFDDDNDCDLADIDALTAVTAAGTNDLSFDLTGDMSVNTADITQWLIDAGARPEHAAATNGNPFFRGDFDLSGAVNGQDFVIWNQNKFTSNTNWSDGNGNGDTDINGADFIIWNTNKFKDSTVDPGAPNITDGGLDLTSSALDRWQTLRSGKKVLLEKQGRFFGTNANQVPIVPQSIEVAESLRGDVRASDLLTGSTSTVKAAASLPGLQLDQDDDWRDSVRENANDARSGALDATAIDLAFADL